MQRKTEKIERLVGTGLCRGKLVYTLRYTFHPCVFLSVLMVLPAPAQAAPRRAVPYVAPNPETFMAVEPESSANAPDRDRPIVTARDPVLMKADEVEYDQPNEIVMATGHVEISQGATIILADTIEYDRKANTVKARGNISMLTPTNDVYFAETLEFKEDLKAGVIGQFKARMADNSVFVASSARKVDDNITELSKAAYTPCKCHDDEGKPKNPMWSLKAEHVTIDQQEQKVRYDDAYLNVSGVPVLYTPYFSHPSPGAENQSGLLMPEFMQSRNLGTVYKQPVYYAIAADRDATFTPILTARVGPVLAGNYRQMLDNGEFSVDGSATNAPNRDAQGRDSAGHELRGHFKAKGDFKIDEHYDWGFNLHRATDDTYLHLYNFSNETILTSRVYAEGFDFVGDSRRNYASMEGLSFQGLTGQETDEYIPVVAPLMNFTWQSNPGWANSRYGFDANAMFLHRETGAGSRRLSGTARLNLPYITDDGQAIEFEAQMRTDIYSVSDVPQVSGARFSGVTGRAVPQVSLLWHYPFINSLENASLMVEPVVNFAVSPGGGNPDKIPNEDSLLPDFTDANLFSNNRFAGLDRIENGPRVSYGMRGHAQVLSDNYIDMLVGQQYRVNNDPTFPISNDLSSHRSDYVGKIDLTTDPFSFGYRFRLDKDDFSSSRSEWGAGYNYDPMILNVSYLALNDDPVLSSREVVNGNATLSLTDEWSVTASGSRDLQLDETVAVYSGVVYKNECVNLTTVVGKDYVRLLDIKPSLTFWFRVTLKNLE